MKRLPYPLAPSKKDKERQFMRFMDICSKLQINLPFMEALEQMSQYAKFMKNLLAKKRWFRDEETIELEARCNAIIQKPLPGNSKDPRGFTIAISIGEISVSKALLDLGASMNLLPLSFLKQLGKIEVKPTRITLQLTDRSIKYPYGVAEDVLVKVDKFFFLVDFVVMDIEEDTEVPLIVEHGTLKIGAQDEEAKFEVFPSTHGEGLPTAEDNL
ncbi:uncharacterized protein LOC113874181 [Abrus precatorius]|uniref:Uncharacterized protein LOC113874181 n=1 Tax=Abrus precatorius TaxID=3816 RepID=A0A8B8MI01_ABRPR|nr:uncharacterized protein LOC113874181 [Abrus precatorius]